MCEASAYLVKGGQEELLLESIDLLECKEGQVTLTNLFGEQKAIEGKIKSLSLVNHKIILEPLK